MMIAHAKGLSAARYEIREADGEHVARLEIPLIREGGRLEHAGRIYRIEREQVVSGPWVLRDGDQVVFEAHKPAVVQRRFLVMVKGANLELSPLPRGARGFKLVGPDWVELGTLRRPSPFSRRVEIDLSDLVPVEAQLFLFALALVIWRRADG